MFSRRATPASPGKDLCPPGVSAAKGRLRAPTTRRRLTTAGRHRPESGAGLPHSHDHRGAQQHLAQVVTAGRQRALLNRHAVGVRHGLILFGTAGTGKTGGQGYRDLLDCRRSLSQALDPAGVAGMFIWPQIDDQRQRSLVTADAQTTNTSEAAYVLTAVST